MPSKYLPDFIVQIAEFIAVFEIGAEFNKLVELFVNE